MSKTSRFAGLISGLLNGTAAEAVAAPVSGATAAKADKPEKKEDESDEDYQSRVKAWEDDKDKEDKDGKKKGADPKDTSEDDQDKEEKLKKAKSAGHAEGIAAERDRWAGVLASDEAKGRVVAACGMLADTDMTAESIKKALAVIPQEAITAAAPRTTLAARHPNPTPAPAVDGGAKTEAGTPTDFASRVSAAVEAARPSKNKAA